MALPRLVEPELLDALPQDDPRARQSRRDLRRVNALMQQARIMTSLLSRHAAAAPRRILELGGGDGTFMLRVAGQLAARWRSVSVALLDRQSLVGAETRASFRALGWAIEPVNADVFEYLGGAPGQGVDIVVANLFLHHFRADALARLMAQAARRAPLFVACEPRRGLVALSASRMLWALGCNDVSRHDARASVVAGFRDRELSALWPRDGDWALHEHAAGPFTHCFVARRRA